MLVLLLLEFDVEDALADRQFTQLVDFFQLQPVGFLGNALQTIQRLVAEVRVLILQEVRIFYFIQMSQLILQFLQQNRSLLLLSLKTLALYGRCILIVKNNIDAASTNAYVLVAFISFRFIETFNRL